MATADLDERMASQFEGNFMDATDIMKAGDTTVTISDVSAPDQEKDATGKSINKAILTFAKAKKRLILNKTNCKVMAGLYGKKATEWIGKPVTLCVRYLETAFGQKNVPVIRIKPESEGNLPFGMRKRYGSPKPFA